jgi:flagellar L-ring protein precursor FlgH
MLRSPLRLTAIFGLALAAAASCLAIGSSAAAESLWDHRDQSSAYLFTDNVAAGVGDSLTVLITDNSSFAKSGKRELSKTSAQSGTASLKKGAEELIPVLELKEGSGRDFTSDANYTGSMTFADSITTTVVDKLPNGNLVIAGRSERSVAGEDVITILTGIVKPEDISGANTISSSRIANFRLYYERNGLDEKFTVMGWLNRILNHIWPF